MNTGRVGAATALWLWHDWRRSGRKLGWHSKGAISDFQQLQGYGRVQMPKRRADPTALACEAYEIAQSVDWILRELGNEDAAVLVMRLVGKATYEEIGTAVGHTRYWASQQFNRAYSQFCTMLDGRATA